MRVCHEWEDLATFEYVNTHWVPSSLYILEGDGRSTVTPQIQ